MKKLQFVCSLFLFMCSTALMAEINLPYGDGNGQLSYINENNFPNLEEPVPYGPLSFRIVDNKFIVADSVKGKILFLGEDGSITSEISALPKDAKKPAPDFEGDPCLQILIDDICPIIGGYGDVAGVWVADSFNNKVIELDMKGNILRTLTNPSFMQVFRVELGANGHLFVADKGAQKIFIFDSELQLVSAVNWEWSGFAVSGVEDNLSRFFFSKETDSLHCVTTNLENKVIREFEIPDLPAHLNPVLWWVDEINEELVMTYTPREYINSDGTVSKIAVAKVGFDGKIKQSGSMKLAIAMNRYIEHSNYENIYIAKTNFHEAPQGKFSIVPYKFKRKK